MMWDLIKSLLKMLRYSNEYPETRICQLLPCKFVTQNLFLTNTVLG